MVYRLECNFLRLLALFFLIFVITACESGASGGSLGANASASCPDGISQINPDGSVSTSSISVDGTHCYSFRAESGRHYQITLNSISGDSDIALHNGPDFSANTVIDFSINDGFNADIITFTPNQSSIYYLEIHGFIAGNYRLAVSENIVLPVASVEWPNQNSLLSSVNLNGSVSNSPLGSSLTYSWVLTSIPQGSNAVLVNDNQAMTSFVPDIFGDYHFSLTVNDGHNDSEAFTGVVNVVNSQPVAIVRPQISGTLSEPVLLDASASTDADGDSLSYHWSLINKPLNSALIFADQQGAVVSFNADTFGDYVFQLIVDDGYEQSIAVTTTVSVVFAFTSLDFRVTDAEYSNSLERIVLVSEDSSAIYTFNTIDQTITSLSLSLAPTAVSVSPDGLFAAVGHNGWISYVDLTTNSVIKTFPVSTDVLDIILDGNGFVHAFPRVDQWERIRSINIVSEQEILSSGNSIYAGTLARLHPNLTAIYGADNGLSPSDIEKYNISVGSAVYQYDSPYHGGFGMCGNLWISEDGLRIFTRCGNVFRSTASQADDMTYNGSLGNLSNQMIVNLSHSSEANQVAAIIQDHSFFDPDLSMDTRIHFYNFDYLTDAGNVTLPDFKVGNNYFPAHGKFIFYNSDGTQYFTIVQADNSSALLNDFAIVSSPRAGDIFGVNKRPVAEAGINQAVNLINSVSLNGSESSDGNGDTLGYNWEIVSFPTGSTLASLANSSSVAPQFTPDVTGTYVIGLTVSDGNLDSVQDTVEITAVNSGDSFLLHINYSITDAEYSDSLESIVAVSSDKNLYRFDTISYQQHQIALPLLPNAVSVSPDGLFAAVGHNGWISYVDLNTNNIIKTFPVTTDVQDIILDSNGFVHAFPRVDQWERIRSVNIATELETLSTGNLIRAGTLARLHPVFNSIYGADNGLSPSDIEKYDISAGPAAYLYDSPYHGDYAMCGNLWISEDGLSIFTRCGNVFRSSTSQSIDMTYNGSLGNLGNLSNRVIVNLSHSSEANQVAAIVKDTSFVNPDSSLDSQIHFYNFDFLTDAGTLALPNFMVGNNSYAAHAKYIFYNSIGTRHFTIVQADSASALLNDFGLYIH